VPVPKLLSTANSLLEAELLVTRLRAHNIEAEIPDRHTAGINPLLTPVMGGVRITVHEEDWPKAFQILNAPEDSSSHLVADELRDYEPTAESCPICKSTDVTPNRPSHSLLDSILSYGLGAMFVVQRKRMRCASCKHVWRTGKASRSAKVGEFLFNCLGVAVLLFFVYAVFFA
jgi:hypothetical protein